MSSVGWQTAPSTAGFFGRGACLAGALSVRGCRLHRDCLVEGGAAPAAACASGREALVILAPSRASLLAWWFMCHFTNSRECMCKEDFPSQLKATVFRLRVTSVTPSAWLQRLANLLPTQLPAVVDLLVLQLRLVRQGRQRMLRIGLTARRCAAPAAPFVARKVSRDPGTGAGRPSVRPSARSRSTT